MDPVAKLFKIIKIVFQEDNLFIKVCTVISLVAGVIAFILYLLDISELIIINASQTLYRSLATLSLSILALIMAYLRSREISESEEKVAEAEERVQKNPNETKAAWDLARIKLESYLDKNLKQVSSIFWLTIFVMIVGFVLIGYGVSMAFDEKTKIEASYLSAATGLLVNFIGATFLVLYKSTMAQAKEYVSILERINAVGMSVQVLEKLENADNDLKHQSFAELAKQLISMYKL